MPGYPRVSRWFPQWICSPVHCRNVSCHVSLEGARFIMIYPLTDPPGAASLCRSHLAHPSPGDVTPGSLNPTELCASKQLQSKISIISFPWTQELPRISITLTDQTRGFFLITQWMKNTKGSNNSFFFFPPWKCNGQTLGSIFLGFYCTTKEQKGFCQSHGTSTILHK